MTITRITPAAGRCCVVMLALLALAGCAANAGRDRFELIDEGHYEQGLANLEEAARAAPRDTRAQLALTTQRGRVVTTLLTQADRARAARDYSSAASGYQRVLGIEPDNQRAREALREIEQLGSLAEMQRQGQIALRRGDLDGAQREVEAIAALDPGYPGGLALKRQVDTLRARMAQPYPQLRSKLSQPVSLEFRDANLKLILEVLSQTAGLNFIIDKDVRPDIKATIFVRQVAVEDAVNLLLQQNQLLSKVVNDNTIVVYPDTPQKLRDYQDLVLRTFYLTNTDAKSAQDMVKTMLKTRDVFIDERLNTLTMRDSAEAVRLAEKLFLAQDQSSPEVVLEVQVMEISRQRVQDLGLEWPQTFSLLDAATLDKLNSIDSARIGISPSPQLKINAKNSAINTLASPVLRVSNREKAKIHIGDRVPVISATSVPSTQGPVITESITYLDVGLKLEVEPTIHLNDEVAIKVMLEVSNAENQPPTVSGTIPVKVTTRNAETVLRLRDGETQVLAGLMRNDHNELGNQIPGLGESSGLGGLFGIGRLFGSRQDDVRKTELVLSITPRIVRNLPYMSPHQMEFPSGTEGSLRVRPVSLRPTSGDSLALALPADAVLAAPLSATASGSAAAPDSPGSLVLSWVGPDSLRVGEEALVVLHAAGNQPLRSSTLQLAYDPAALQISEVSEGDFLGQGNSATTFAPRLDEQNGRLYVAMSRADSSGASGEGGLLRLRVKALQASEAAVPIRLLTFSAVGQGNRLVSAPLPAAKLLAVGP
ncbi:general secretion pathway protein D [Geopseudomonas sagittaria]|uniref:General secretion pathway protein D n=1 Tax=Geopseudomonas sagittaria TaxID=1135990 RepID=A0A1I5Q4K2_9GAMM|nr:general secretion pathway protein D [Pseudomonas sagittaria]